MRYNAVGTRPFGIRRNGLGQYLGRNEQQTFRARRIHRQPGTEAQVTRLRPIDFSTYLDEVAGVLEEDRQLGILRHTEKSENGTGWRTTSSGNDFHEAEGYVFVGRGSANPEILALNRPPEDLQIFNNHRHPNMSRSFQERLQEESEMAKTPCMTFIISFLPGTSISFCQIPVPSQIQICRYTE
ncbi:MAG TPA: hypothetical protein VGK34_04340 [Armatimonadota bacterium]